MPALQDQESFEKAKTISKIVIPCDQDQWENRYDLQRYLSTKAAKVLTSNTQ